MNRPLCHDPAWFDASPTPAAWDVLRRRGKRPINYRSNIRVILERDHRLQGRLRRDTLAQRIEWADRPGTCALHDIEVFFERVYGFRPRDGMLRQELLRVATPHHPVAAWLDELDWDGTPRLDGFMNDLLGARPSPLAAVYGRRLFIGLVARAREPGAKVDTLTVFSGPQGIHKSTMVAALCPNPDWYASIRLDVVTKDGMQDLQGKWILEIAEMDGLKRGSAESLKAFLSKTHDRYRASYGHRSEDFPRTCVMLGTTNEDELLNDPTGARRFWPVALTRRIDLDRLAAVRDQLFAEADVLYREGERWWLQEDEERQHARETQGWREVHPWEELLWPWLNGGAHHFTSAEALDQCLGIPLDRQTPTHRQEVGRALRALGMKTIRPRPQKGSRSPEGPRPRFYVWPDGSGPA